MPPLDLVISLLLQLILPAAAASLLVMAAVALPRVPKPWWEVIAAAAMLAGMIAGNAVRGTFPLVPDYPGWRWLVVGVSGVLVATSIASLFRKRWLTVMLAAGSSASLGYFLLPDPEIHTLLWIGSLIAIVAANAAALAWTAERYPGWIVASMWGLILCGGTTLLLLYAGSARLADGGILLGAALLGPALFSLRWPLDLKLIAPAFALGLVALLLSGGYETYTDVPKSSFVIVALAPMSLLLMLLPPVQRWPHWRQWLLLVLLPLIPIAFGLGLAIRAVGWALG